MRSEKTVFLVPGKPTMPQRRIHFAKNGGYFT
ncbi:hypothetical protein CF65_00117 [Aggregatibacter actinomycetemcomitans HK1651]|nr:hypothetical protein CF65_00117 [Aggregatibacter actinomycetemcomitans HK1651]